MYLLHPKNKNITAGYAVILLSLLAGCDVTGEAVESPSNVSLVFISYVSDPITFTIDIDGNPVEGNQIIKFQSNPVHLKITEAVSNRVVYDDPFTLNLIGGSTRVGVYQYSPGTLPACIAPPEDEPIPSEGYTKISFLYNFTDYPDSIKVVAENTTTPESDVYVPTDSLVLKKNRFSDFLILRSVRQGAGTNGNIKATGQLKFYSTGNSRQQIGFIPSGTFQSMGEYFSMYVATDYNKSTGNVSLSMIY